MDDQDYSDRKPEEIAALEQTFRSPGGPRNYVAAPAPGWDVRGLWHCFDSGSRSGYAAHAVGLHWVLNNWLKIPTQLVPHRSLDVDIERFPADRYEMLFDWHKNAVGIPELMIVSFPPDTAAEQAGVHGRVIPYCAFEGHQLSQPCAQLCNGPAFESIWVVSDFVRNAFILSGVEPSRVHTVEPLLCGGPYPMPALEQLVEASEKRTQNNEPFRFGVMGTWHSRKGFHQLLEAYWSEFSRDENVELLIRTSNFGRHRTIKEFQEAVTEEMKQIAASLGHPNWPEKKTLAKVKLLTGTALTDAEVIEWIASLDCYVNPSYGEGLGIPQHWAKACNLPLVTSDYGAVGELCDQLGGDVVFQSQAVPVNPEVSRISFMFDRQTLWGGYQTEDLATSMRMAYQEGRRSYVHPSAVQVREMHGPTMAAASALEALS